MVLELGYQELLLELGAEGSTGKMSCASEQTYDANNQALETQLVKLETLLNDLVGKVAERAHPTSSTNQIKIWNVYFQLARWPNG